MIHPDVVALFREALEPRRIVECMNDLASKVDTLKMSTGEVLDVLRDMHELRNLARAMTTDAGAKFRTALGLPCK